MQDPSLNDRMLSSDNSVAQLQGDRNKKEGGASASHSNSGNGHEVQGVKAMIFVLSVVDLEGSYSLCHNLGFRISPVAEGLILNEHKKNEIWVMDKTNIHLSGTVAFTTDSERDNVTCRYSSSTFIVA